MAKKYIDAETFKEYCVEGLADMIGEFKTEKSRQLATEVTKAIARDIDEFPAADVRENVRGEWKKCGKGRGGRSDSYECSACGGLVQYAYYVEDIDYDFCPNCGAVMGKKETQA